MHSLLDAGGHKFGGLEVRARKGPDRGTERLARALNTSSSVLPGPKFSSRLIFFIIYRFLENRGGAIDDDQYIRKYETI
jgi:hypothetical protein